MVKCAYCSSLVSSGTACSQCGGPLSAGEPMAAPKKPGLAEYLQNPVGGERYADYLARSASLYANPYQLYEPYMRGPDPSRLSTPTRWVR